MKNPIFSLIVLSALSSCKKESEKQGICQLSSGYVDESLYADKINYNSNGDITSLRTDGAWLNVKYTGNMVELYDHNGELAFFYEKNADQLITKRTLSISPDYNQYYEYDSKGFLIAEKSKYDSIIHFIENEDRVKSYHYREFPPGVDTITYEYYPEIDPAWGAPALKGKGKLSRHLLKKEIIQPGVKVQAREYKYLRNEYGYVTRITVTTNSASMPMSDVIQLWICK